ncbi:MAG: hydroxyacylglutathione hydrolase [Pseudomarimonas sp.]
MSLRALPALSDNYIWLLTRRDGTAIIVDPGDAAPVLAAINEGLRPVAILVTHHHPDHIDGIAEIVATYPVPVYAPVDVRIPTADFRVAGGDEFVIATLGLNIRVMAVPGHTRSHVAYYDGSRLFCGDTLFSLGCGRLFEGSPAQMLDALDHFSLLPAATVVCCTHEYTAANGLFASVVDPQNLMLRKRIEQVHTLRQQGIPSLPTTIGSECACNPFLRIDSASVRKSITQQIGQDLDDRVARFAALRRWKDGFTADIRTGV